MFLLFGDSFVDVRTVLVPSKVSVVNPFHLWLEFRSVSTCSTSEPCFLFFSNATSTTHRRARVTSAPDDERYIPANDFFEAWCQSSFPVMLFPIPDQPNGVHIGFGVMHKLCPICCPKTAGAYLSVMISNFRREQLFPGVPSRMIALLECTH